MRTLIAFLALGVGLLHAGERPLATPHNAIIFVADGMRGAMVDPVLTPNMHALRTEGVDFANSHSLFPTVTTANASAIATGHGLGDTGDFANTLYAGFPARLANGESSVTPFVEDDVVLRELDEHFGGDYLDEETLLANARSHGFSTAALGKLGPALIQDHVGFGDTSIVIDDRSGLVDERTGRAEGVPLSSDVVAALGAAGLASTPPATDKPNRAQQRYFVDVATKVVLPLFKQRAKPFVMVVWMRDPDTTQHSQLDSRYGLVPGINGSTSLDAIRNTDANLGAIRAALKALVLDRDTDLFVTSDHGFSTISKQSDTSRSSKCRYDDVPEGSLPPGFLALDIAVALDLPLHDPDAKGAEIDRQIGCEAAGYTRKETTPPLPRHPRSGSALLGTDAAHPDLVITAGAGSDLIYFTNGAGTRLAPLIVNFLLGQDYTGGVFVDDAFGRLPGTIPFSAIGLNGSARTPRPAIVVSLRSFSTGCDDPLRCGAEIADTSLSQGQGMHGTFGRADTFNVMAATGPDFRRHFKDSAPASNADIAITLAQVLGLTLQSHGSSTGRVLVEALPGGKLPGVVARTCFYTASDAGRWPSIDTPPLLHLQPALRLQTIGGVRYVDAAGLLGRTLGLDGEGGAPCAN